MLNTHRWHPINVVKAGQARRVLVTGSRGKSTIVRLLHAALQDAGLQTYARITGVEPREIGPRGVRTISRSAGAHVEEMRWWLRKLPASAQGVILENSAISPDLQDLAGRWLRPDLTILSNTLPDHQEAWGPTRTGATEALVAGVPVGGRVIVPIDLQADQHLCGLLEKRRCGLLFAKPSGAGGEGFEAANLGLAATACTQFGFDKDQTLKAMRTVGRDKYDFRVLDYAGAELALAFSVNDIASTRMVFRSLCWPEHETRLIYNHRKDRPERLRSFFGWLNNSDWRDVLIIGDKPYARLGVARYLDIKSGEGLRKIVQPGDRIFGCGNIAGLPLSLVTALD